MKPDIPEQIRYMLSNIPAYTVEDKGEGILEVYDRDTGRRYEVAITRF